MVHVKIVLRDSYILNQVQAISLGHVHTSQCKGVW